MVSVRLSQEEEFVFRQYAKIQGKSISEMIRSTVLEKIQEEHDIDVYRASMEEVRAGDEVMSQEDVEGRLNVK